MPRRPSPLTPDYQWDDKAGRYTSKASGRYVKAAAVKTELEKVAAASGDNIRGLAQSLRNGELTLSEWQTAMAKEIKTVHVANCAAARGGWAQMSQSDYGYAGSLVKEQLKYLDNFAREIESGKQALNGRLETRAGMYANAGRGSYERMRERYQRNNNQMTEERRILHAAESCEDCIQYAQWGWVPIGTLPRIGDSRCRTNCRCTIEYRKPAPDGGYVMAGG